MSITKIKASNITDGSITASKLANTYALSTDSISAGTYANTAIANASSASLYANTGITIAQASFNAANNVMPQIQPAFDAANSASAYANTGINNAASASAYANTGINNAASASLYANTKVSKSGDTITGPIIISDTGSGALQVAGTVTISKDLNVSGNIFLSGSTTTISSNNLTLSDPLVYLAVGNVANTADIGIVGHVTNGHYYHTGMVRDHLDGTWKFFSNVTSEPTTTINFGEANTVYDVIRVGGVVSPSALINGRELGTYTQSAYDKANTAVTSVSGTGTVSGLTLTGTVTSTGSLTLGGTITGFPTGSGTSTGTNTGDQTLPVASSTTPAALGVAAVGIGTTFARADHVHLQPTLATLGAQAAGTYATGTGTASGTNTGDQTNISGNAATASNVVGTNLGKTGGTGFFTTTGWTATDWSNLAIGGGGMAIASTPGGASTNYGFFTKVGNRDGGGGWGGIWMDYSAGDCYYGNTTVVSNATWYKLAKADGSNASGTWGGNAAGLSGGSFSGNLYGSSRLNATTYTNSTGRVLFLHIGTTNSPSNGTVAVNIGGQSLNMNGYGSFGGASWIVPPGVTYSISASGATVRTWYEF